MTYEIMMAILVIVAALTGLVTQAVKMIFDEYSIPYHANMLAGGIALALSLAIGFGYAILTGAAINARFMIWLIALVFLSWLSAMVGYDKVIQTLTQIKGE